MLPGIEAQHAWVPGAGSGVLRTNLVLNPDGEEAQALTSNAEFTNTTVTAAGEGITALAITPTGGSKVDKAVFAAGAATPAIGYVPVTFGGAGTYAVSMYVFLPVGWDGGDVSISPEEYAGSSNVTLLTAKQSKAGAWQRIACRFTPVGGDLIGKMFIRSSAKPTVGKAAYVSAILIEASAQVNPYFPTFVQLLTGLSKFTGALRASTSTIAGPSVILNRPTDDSNLVVQMPWYKLVRVSGLHSLGDSDDRRDPQVRRLGEIPRLSYRRGKTITYEGWVIARSLRTLREAENELRAAFADQTIEGRMDMNYHPLNPDFIGVSGKYAAAKSLGVEIIDEQESPEYKRRFVAAIRTSDPRVFDSQLSVSATASFAESNTTASFA